MERLRAEAGGVRDATRMLANEEGIMYQNAYSKSNTRHMAIAVALGLLAQVLPVATAATKTFDGGGTNGATLDVSANWNSDGIPVTTDEALLDDTSFALPATLTLSNAPTFGDLLINSTSLTNITLTGAAARNITLSGGGGIAAVTAAGGATNDLVLLGSNVHNTVTIGGGSGAGKLGLALGRDGQFDVVNVDATLNITGIVSGAFNLTKTGPGVLTLAGANTHGGAGKTDTLSGGTLNINNATALGSANNVFVINGGTKLDNTSGAAITTGNNPLSLNGNFTFTGTTNLAFGTGAITNAGDRTITITGASKTLTMGGVMTNTKGAAQTNTVNGAGNTLALGGYALSGNANNYIDVILGTGNVAITGPISSGTGGSTASGLTYGGSGILTLSGANTLTGGIALNSGTLVATVAGGFGTAANTLTFGGGNLELRSAAITYTGGIDLSGADETVTINPAAAGNGVTHAISGAATLGTHTTTISAGTLTTGGTAYGLTLSGTSTLNGNPAFLINNNGSGSGTLTLGAITGGANTLTIQGAGNFAQTGIWSGNGSSLVLDSTYSGMATLSGASTFSGGVTIKSGTLIGKTSTNAFGSGTITIGAGSGTNNATLAGGSTTVFSNAIVVASGNTGIARYDGGSTFGGPVTLNNHGLTVSSGTGAAALTGSIGGTGDLTLSTVGANAVTLSTGLINMNGSVINNGAGSAAANIYQSLGVNVANVIQNSATSMLILRSDNTNAAATILSGTLQGLTSGNAFGIGTITLGAASGTNNATLAGNSTTVFTNAIAVAGGNTGVATISGTAGGPTFSGPITLNSHALTVGTAGGTLTVSGGITGTGDLTLSTDANALTLSTGAINMNGSIISSGTGAGGLTISAPLGTNVQGIIQNNANSTLTLSGANSYTGPTTVSAGTVKFQKISSWQGTAVTVTNAGSTLYVNCGGPGEFANTDVAALLSKTTFGAGTVFEVDTRNDSVGVTNISAVISGPEGLTKVGGGNGYNAGQGTLNLLGSNTYTGVTTLGPANGGNNDSILEAGVAENPGVLGPFGNGGPILFNGGALEWSAANTYDYSSVGRFAVSSGQNYKFYANGQTVTLAGNLPTNGVNGLSLGAGGTLVLSGNNTFAGAVDCENGTLSVASLNYVANGTWAHHADGYSNLGAPTTATAGTINFSGNAGGNDNVGKLIYTGTGETTDRKLGGGGWHGSINFFIYQSGSGLLKFTSPIALSGQGMQLDGSTAGTGEISGAMSGGTWYVVKAGTGTWTLSGSNTYISTTTIQNGNLCASSLNSVNGGTPLLASSSLGAPTNVALGTISIGSTTNTGLLTYTGPGETSDRVINLAGTTGGVVLDASGSGPLVLTSSFTTTGAGSKTLTLQGTNTGANAIQGAITNNSSANRTALVKTGTGAWILSGTNTYTGPTTVSNGTLGITGTIVSPATVCTGAVLSGTGAIVTNNATALIVNAGGIIDPGSVGGIGTLTVTGNVFFATNGLFRVDASGANADLLAVSGTVGGGPVLVKVNGAGVGPWKIMTANNITASFTTDAPGYTVTKRNANTELWLAGRGGTGIFFR